MSKPFRFGSAISLIALSTMIAGCAAPQGRATSVSGFGGKANGEVGLATRALAALAANDAQGAIGFAERAVEKTPDDAGFRALLGNAYFAAGRFASAEAAFKDALTIYSNQPNVVLKLALAQIAQGKNAEAVQFLDAARNVLDPSDYGLALALAGRPGDAISVLEPAARAQGADARLRQNLALAYAFSGNWDNARAIAAQDVPGDQLDTRIHQWMQLTNPSRPSDQVAALIGVKPVASDPGQPTRLALHQPDTRQAQAAPAPSPAPVVAEQPQVAETAPLPPNPPAPEPAPVVAEAPAPQPAVTIAQAAAAAPEAPAAFAALMPKAPPPPRKVAPVRRAAAPAERAPVHNAAFRKGNSQAVVQLGAYRSPEWVATAWNTIARRHSVLRNYTPMSARFDSPKGTFYRLSVKGFASDRDARLACESLRRAGASCFVRNVAGDAPVQIASR
jgi:Flp pilus assembly protein TadD